MTNHRSNFVPGDDGFRKGSTHPTRSIVLT
jgi:hypothetical protein